MGCGSNLCVRGCDCRRIGHTARRRRAFTLIEAAFVTIVIGVCCVSTLQLLAVGTVSNDAAADMTIAANLANSIHEITSTLPLYDPQTPTIWAAQETGVANYDNVTDFDGLTFNPPINSNRSTISTLANWSQVVAVNSVSEDNVNTTVANSTSQKSARVTVTINHAGRTIYQTSWVVAVTTGG